MTLALANRRAALMPPWAKNDLWRRARAVPSLDLRFADNKSLVDAVTGASLVTFNRASNGTFVDSAGVLQTASTDVPRFDHNPITGESLGLLVEEQRTNLLTRSEEFGTTWSALNSSISANATTAPDGATTADKVVENTATNVHGVSRGGGSESLVNGTVYTFSVYAKAAERSFIWMQALNSFAKSFFNLSTGAVSASGAGHTSTISPAGNGWYRCAITFTSDQTNNSYRAIGMSQVSGTESYTGDNASGVFLWGADLQAGAFPTSYIPTTTAAVTRSADVASITGSAFSGWYRQDEGTVFAEGSGFAPTLRWGAFNSVASFSECINFGSVTSGQAELTVRTPTTTTAVSITAGSILTAGVVARDAFRYAVNDFAVTRNGVTPSTLTSGNLPNARNTFYIGVSANTFTYHNGHIRRLTFWGQRLPNNVLQTLTQ